MSSINFTGLNNIKVGGTDCTVYLGANKMWPTTVSVMVNLNNQWRKSTYWSQAGYTCYESNSNHNVKLGYSSMQVIIPEGISSFTVYFGSDGNGYSDYSVLWELDKDKPTSNPGYLSEGAVATSYGKQKSKIAYTYTISDTSKSHFFWITYRKSTYDPVGTDRGYLLIKPYISVTT